MTWLPHFLNGPAALLAALLAIPLLILLYFLKLRRREQTVPSTFLWKKAIEDLQVNAPFQKLRRNLLLFLQLLILTCLLLALARPILRYLQGADQINVILIDHSASMSAIENGHTRLDEAKRRAKDLVNTLPRNAQAMVIAFDDSAQIEQTFTSDASALRAAIDAIQPTDRRSRLKLAYQMAEAQSTNIFSDTPAALPPKPHVWLYSDGRALDADQVTLHANLTFEKIGQNDTPNIAIVALAAKRDYEHPTQVQVFARLENFGPEPASNVPVQLSVNDHVASAAMVNLLPQRYSDDDRKTAIAGGFVPRDSVQFPDLSLDHAAVLKVEQMETAHDALAADNAAWVVVPPPRQLSVLLVSGGDYFLDRALDVLPLKKPARMSPSEYEQQVPTDYDVIIFDGVTPKKLPPSGSFLYFGVCPPGIALKAATDPQGEYVEIPDATVLDWKRDDPILRSLNLDRVYAKQQIKLTPTLDSQVLVEGSGGPLVVLHREGRNTHLIVAFTPLESNWPLKASFPVFLQNALRFLAIGSDMDVRQSYEPGASVRVSRENIAQSDPNLKTFTLRGPAGDHTADRTVEISPGNSDIVLPTMDRVGIYETIPAISGYEHIAVNLLDANESNLLPADNAPGGEGESNVVGNIKSSLELWRWLVMGGLGALMVEWWVYARRVRP